MSFEHFDLSLDNRRKTKNKVIDEAANTILRTGLGLKAATITPTDHDDVGSPNAILREAIDAEVILRTGRRIPGVRPIGGVYSPISVVRMARDDAYGAKEWREGKAGSLDEMLLKVAEAYEEEVNNAVDALSSLLEPLIIVFIGTIVGTMVIAMYLPIFKMASVI